MDYNSPIYREKYLKYKKKYLELKALEEQEGGAPSVFEFFKTPAYKTVNNAVSKKFESDKSSALLLIKLDGLNSSQKTTVRGKIDETLASSMVKSGPVKTALSANKDEKINADEFLKKTYKANLKVGDKTFENISEYVKAELQDKTNTLYDTLSKEVKTESVVKGNAKGTTEANIQAVKVFNAQIAVEKLCEKLGLAVDACDEGKKESYPVTTKVLNKFNSNNVQRHTQIKNKVNDLEKAKKALLELAKSFAPLSKEEAPAEGTEVTKEKLTEMSDKILNNQKQALLTALKLTDLKPEDIKYDEATKTYPKILEAFAKKEYTVDKEVAKQLKDVGNAPSPKTETGSPKAEDSKEAPKEAPKPESKEAPKPESKEAPKPEETPKDAPKA